MTVGPPARPVTVTLFLRVTPVVPILPILPLHGRPLTIQAETT
jgi:hypothetical protein